MHFLKALLALPIAAAALSPREATTQADFVGQDPVISGKKFIVEVGSGDDLESLKTEVQKRGGKVLKTFNSELFRGMSVESEAENADSLQNVASVVKAWPMAIVKLSPVEPSATFNDDLGAQNYSIHKYTGVDKAHEAGILGKGAVVAVVDTGVEYTHPALGGCLGEGCKIAGGYDLVGDGTWPSEERDPDADPMDYQGHGTHVTGIIAGKTDSFTGVAPEATILSYKVFSQLSGTTEDILIEAFLRAYEDGADIITSSIGGTNGFTSNAWAVVASRLVDNGVIVTIAAGNEGGDGPFYGSNGALGDNVIAVASTDAQELSADPFDATFTLDGVTNTTTLGYRPSFDPWNLQGLPIIPVSFNTSAEAEACEPFEEGAMNFTGAIALVRRGSCEFSVKQQNLAALGAKYVLVYNTDSMFVFASSLVSDPDLGMIEKDAGEAIIATVKAGGTVVATFDASDNHKVGAYNSAGGIPSQFTTWGGSFELNVKPDVAAPGGYIYSTYLDGSWAILSGTSMATPYVAGVAALWVSKFGGRKEHGVEWAKNLSNRIISSGGSLPWQTIQPEGPPVEYGYWAPVNQVGTGQIDAWKVLNYTTSLSFDKIALNDTNNFSRYHKVDITNNGDKELTYTFKLQPAGGVNIKSHYTWFVRYLLGTEPVTMVPEVSFPTGTFKVAPGQTKTAQFNFKPFESLEQELMPVYSGKVLISSSSGEQVSVPYMGLGFNLKTTYRRNLFTDTTPYQYGGPNRDDIQYYNKYDFNASWYIQNFPKVYSAVHWGTKELRWDLYEAGWREHKWSYPPVPGVDGHVGSVAYYARSASYWAFDPSFMDRDETVAFPVYDVPRSSEWTRYSQAFWWMGKLANGSYIQPGKYVMRFAALIPFGNPDHSDNWHVWDTPEIEVLPLAI